MQLGYLVLETQKLADWKGFAEQILGLEITHLDLDTLHARMDGLQQRLVIQQGSQEDIAAAGLVTGDIDAFEGILANVRAGGGQVEEMSEDFADRRRMKRVARFRDSAGLTIELATGPYHAVRPFSSPLVPGGFLTGQHGLGHAVLMVDDLGAALGFWTQTLGFKLSDTSAHETPAGRSDAAFLHCNKRHHSIALVRRPERSIYPRRLLHFMIEANLMDSVGMAYDRALDAGLTINRSLGRHPNDRMFSFYATTPSGFDYEFGWGAVEVDKDWAADHYDHISAWGHRPIRASA